MLAPSLNTLNSLEHFCKYYMIKLPYTHMGTRMHDCIQSNTYTHCSTICAHTFTYVHTHTQISHTINTISSQWLIIWVLRLFIALCHKCHINGWLADLLREAHWRVHWHYASVPLSSRRVLVFFWKVALSTLLYQNRYTSGLLPDVRRSVITQRHKLLLVVCVHSGLLSLLLSPFYLIFSPSMWLYIYLIIRISLLLLTVITIFA